jgi:hypothetical protein
VRPGGGRDVAFIPQRRATCPGDLSGDGVGRTGVRAGSVNCTAQVVDHDGRSASSQEVGVGSADPASGAGHDRDAAVEAIVAWV